MFAKEAKEAKNVQTIDLSLLLGCRQVHFLTVAIMGIAFCRHNILVARRPFPYFHATNIYCFNFHFYNLNISLLIFILNLYHTCIAGHSTSSYIVYILIVIFCYSGCNYLGPRSLQLWWPEEKVLCKVARMLRIEAISPNLNKHWQCDGWRTSWDWLTVQVTPPWWDYDYDYDYFEQSGALMLHIALFVLVCCFCCMLLTTSLVSPSKGSGSETTSLKSETFASFRPRLRKKSFSLCSCSFDNTANEFISNWIHAI